MNYNEYDEAIIESALDIYDEYDVSMEEAVDIAMEKMSTIDKIGRSVFPYSYKGRGKRHMKTLNSYDKKMQERIDKAFGEYFDAYYDCNMSKEDKEKYEKRHDDLVSRRQRMKYREFPIRDAAINAERRNASKIAKVAAAGAGLAAGGVALYKYRKKKLAEAAKLQKEAEEAEAKAAQKQSEAEDAVAQAKEASVYFDY